MNALTKYIAGCALTVVLFGSCSDIQQKEEADLSGKMTFSATHPDGNFTKATGGNFDSGDRIGLFVTRYENGAPLPLQISGNYVNNLPARLTQGKWETSKLIFWPESAVDVYAYYPYLSLTSVDENQFKVALNQNSAREGDQLGGYEVSDILWAKTTGAEAQNGMVPLQFRHCMSRICVLLKKGPDYDGELPENAQVFIHNTVPEALIDLSTGTVTKDIYGKPASIICKKVNNARYEAIIVPQRIDSRRPLIEIIAGNISFLIEDQFRFKNGTSYDVTVTLNSDPDKISIDIGGGIGGGWN